MNKKNNILLSISLIVKNEEENLARCLDSLKPIMEAIPCQLIITDTGSTDKTVEIAKDYTDEVYSFEWCDDFAAARNFGLRKAKGQWFMFIDADEWFEDTRDIEQFFISGEFLNYDNAAYKIRNYLHIKDKNDFLDQNIVRLFNLTNDTKFIGKIHEYIPMKERNAYLSSYIHHFSYAKDLSEIEKKAKQDRNLNLLLNCHKEEPRNIRWNYLLAQEYKAAQDMDKFIEIVNESFIEIQNNLKSPYYFYFLRYKSMQYKESLPYKGIELLSKYFSEKRERQAWDLDLMATLADLYHVNKDYNKAIDACDNYFEIYKDFEQNKLKKGESFIAAPPNFTSKEFKKSINILKSKSMIRLERLEEAKEILKELELSELALDEFSEVIWLKIYICSKNKDFSSLAESYAELSLKNCKALCERISFICEEFLKNNLDMSVLLNSAFISCYHFSNLKNDKYILLHNFRNAVLEDEEKAENLLNKFFEIQGRKVLDTKYSEFLVFGIIWRNKCAEEALKDIDIDDIQNYNKKIFNLYSGLPGMILSYIRTFHIQEIENKQLFFLMSILEFSILVARQFDIEIRYHLIKIYSKIGYEYIHRVYSIDILKKENVEILPRSLRFVYYLHEGFNKIETKEYSKGFDYFKSAVKNYAIFSEEIKLILDYIESDCNLDKIENEAKKREFDLYAQCIKKKILEIYEEGMGEDAIKLLSSYKKINPKDQNGIAEIERVLKIDN